MTRRSRIWCDVWLIILELPVLRPVTTARAVFRGRELGEEHRGVVHVAVGTWRSSSGIGQVPLVRLVRYRGGERWHSLNAAALKDPRGSWPAGGLDSYRVQLKILHEVRERVVSQFQILDLPRAVDSHRQVFRSVSRACHLPLEVGGPDGGTADTLMSVRGFLCSRLFGTPSRSRQDLSGRIAQPRHSGQDSEQCAGGRLSKHAARRAGFRRSFIASDGSRLTLALAPSAHFSWASSTARRRFGRPDGAKIQIPTPRRAVRITEGIRCELDGAKATC